MALNFKITFIRLAEAHFSINHAYTWENGKSVELSNNVEIKYEKTTDNTIRVLVSVSSDSDTQPFRFSVVWEGRFFFEDKPLLEELDRIARINCASIIFAYVRESVADLTRRANIPPLNLPPFNFVSFYEENQKSESPAKPRKKREKSKAS